MIAGPNFRRDESGQWWHHSTSNGKPVRVRALTRTCLKCGQDFISMKARNLAKYCSRVCSSRHSKEKDPSLFHGARAGRWKGGRTERRGYVFIWRPDHPALSGTKRKYVAEHRLVMEASLGRHLERHEQVHHKNGIKNDNRIENLELWSVQQPAGQRVNEKQHCPTCTCFACD